MDLVNLGEMQQAKEQISIWKGASLDCRRETLLHEIIEALRALLELQIPHPDLTALSAGLYAVLRDNPKLVRKLLGAKKGSSHA